MPLADWGYFIEEWWPHILPEVVVMMAHHPRSFATPGGLPFLMCGLLAVSEELRKLFGKKGRGAWPTALYPGRGFRTGASAFLHGINGEVSNCSPFSFGHR
jgi:hypothetical protein